jgi:hypothetical protein
MSIIHIEADQGGSEVRPLIQAAIAGEIAKLELGLDMARRRLAPYEEKYKVTSRHFLAQMTAEDLEGGDQEYVIWAGEAMLMERLKEKLRILQTIQYRD